MTDLERELKELYAREGEPDEWASMWRELDAHLREDAERGAFHKHVFLHQEAELARLREENEALRRISREQANAAEVVNNELARLREENKRYLDHFEWGDNALTAEITRLREKTEVQAEMLEQSYKELARLREASTKDRQTILLQNVDLDRLREDYAGYKKQTEAAWARHQDEVTGLREELEGAAEMLAWAYQWVDPHKHVAVDIAEFLRARNALKGDS